jgi:hypothetical protein
VEEPRIIAIDWSGRRGRDQARVIWLGEVVGGQLVRLESGRTRTEIVDLLIAEASRDPSLIVGLDFAFSVPAWYLHDRWLAPPALWAKLRSEALTPAMRRLGLARWLNEPEFPFWTTRESHALLAPGMEFRRTENEVRRRGIQPKSVFQLVGAGQVGRGSLYGMQALDWLAASGFRIWPFDPPGFPLVVEIFPRLLTGPVRRNSEGERNRYLARVPMASELRERAVRSEDAFDAAVSALVMGRAVGEFVALSAEPDYGLEGKIWQPSVPVNLGAADAESRVDANELIAALAHVIREAAAHGESAELQAEQVLGELSRRGLIRG